MSSRDSIVNFPSIATCSGAFFCYHNSMAGFSASSKEKFLILDVGANEASALFLNFDERRELILEKTVSHIDLKKFLAAQAGSIFQKSWEGNYFFRSRRRLVVLADANLATTLPVPLDFRRKEEAVHEPITLGEAEDWFARATAKIFTGCRLEAGRRLGTGDIDTVLVGQRISRTAVDGRVVQDPLGHVGGKISFVFELTFAKRELAETLAPFFNAPGEFFFAEAPQARLAALARVRPLPVNIIETGDDGRSSLFILQEAEPGYRVLYREPFPWDGTAMLRSIAHDLGVSPSAAEGIYGKYIRHEISDAAKKYLDALAAPSSERFFHALDKAHLRGTVYYDAPRGLPFGLPRRRRAALIEAVPVDALLRKFGFSTGAAQVSSCVGLRYLAPFLEIYFENSRFELNELLRKKLHWLGK